MMSSNETPIELLSWKPIRSNQFPTHVAKKWKPKEWTPNMCSSFPWLFHLALTMVSVLSTPKCICAICGDTPVNNPWTNVVVTMFTNPQPYPKAQNQNSILPAGLKTEHPFVKMIWYSDGVAPLYHYLLQTRQSSPIVWISRLTWIH